MSSQQTHNSSHNSSSSTTDNSGGSSSNNKNSDNNSSSTNSNDNNICSTESTPDTQPSFTTQKKIKIASSSIISKESEDNGSSSKSTTNVASSSSKPIPITHRGLFYGDEFFQDARVHFDQVLKDTLQLCHAQGEGKVDDFQLCHVQDQGKDDDPDYVAYRKLRKEDLQDCNRAISFTEDQYTHRVVLDLQDFMKGDIKVMMTKENELVVKGFIEDQERSFRQCFPLSDPFKSDDISATISSDGVLTILIAKSKDKQAAKYDTCSQVSMTKSCKSKQAPRHGRNSESCMTKSSQSAEKDLDEPDAIITGDTTQNPYETNEEKETSLPIISSEPFYQDSRFESVHKDFERCIQEILTRKGCIINPAENIKETYKRFQQNQHFRDEDRALSVIEEQDLYKVVLDVNDFINDKIEVRIINENELKIEGSIQPQTDGSLNKNFSRSFTFSGLIKANNLTSFLSSDGILVVNIPKIRSITLPQTQSTSLKLQCESGSGKKMSPSTSTSDKGSSENQLLEETETSAFQLLSDNLKEANCLRTIGIPDQGSSIKRISEEIESSGSQSSCENSNGQEVFPSTSHHLDKESFGKRTRDETESGESLSSSDESPVPMTYMGQFFHGGFFKPPRKDFENTVQEVLKKWNGIKYLTDEINRDVQRRDEIFAEDNTEQKIVVDIKEKIKEFKVENELHLSMLENNNFFDNLRDEFEKGR